MTKAEEIKQIIDVLSEPASKMGKTVIESYKINAAVDIVWGLSFLALLVWLIYMTKKAAWIAKESDEGVDISIFCLFIICCIVALIVSLANLSSIGQFLSPELYIFRTIFN